MNQFGGNWTEQKIQMVVGYAKAYLTIMNMYPRFKTLYFDGFAGSGNIYKEEGNDIELIKGTAVRILEINQPKPFDVYYFVERSETNKNKLQALINTDFIGKTCHIVNDDCNNKLISMAAFLKDNPNFRVLAFIDPFGMAVNWSSLEHLKDLGIDIWILVPTGIGVNRLLKKDGHISDSWLSKLEKFIGLPKDKIIDYFYKTKTIHTLFGEETNVEKEKQAIEKASQLYRERLNEIFKYVSQPLALKNSTGSIMYHFMMATNNKAALGIANDVTKEKNLTMAQSSIEWTEMTWNPTTGCDKISAGCKYCYAEVMTRRLYAMGVEKYKDGFQVRTHENELNTPYKWKASKIVFVNSMSDLFHPEVPLEFIQKVFVVMNDTPQHTYQVLTKRADRLFQLHEMLNWTSNIWMGVSVEDSRVTQRIDFLRKTNAQTKFLSCEPLIGPLTNMNLQNIDWVIVGGESGRKARPIMESWVWDIKLQCQEQGAAFFFKQWGGVNKKKSGRLLGERTYDEMPALNPLVTAAL